MWYYSRALLDITRHHCPCSEAAAVATGGAVTPRAPAAAADPRASAVCFVRSDQILPADEAEWKPSFAGSELEQRLASCGAGVQPLSVVCREWDRSRLLVRHVEVGFTGDAAVLRPACLQQRRRESAFMPRLSEQPSSCRQVAGYTSRRRRMRLLLECKWRRPRGGYNGLNLLAPVASQKSATASTSTTVPLSCPLLRRCTDANGPRSRKSQGRSFCNFKI